MLFSPIWVKFRSKNYTSLGYTQEIFYCNQDYKKGSLFAVTKKWHLKVVRVWMNGVKGCWTWPEEKLCEDSMAV